MTRIGSPLWAAPEVLGGRRYCEHVDTYSLGVVMFEIAVRAYPYAKRLREFKNPWRISFRVKERVLRTALNVWHGRPENFVLA